MLQCTCCQLSEQQAEDTEGLREQEGAERFVFSHERHRSQVWVLNCGRQVGSASGRGGVASCFVKVTHTPPFRGRNPDHPPCSSRSWLGGMGEVPGQVHVISTTVGHRRVKPAQAGRCPEARGPCPKRQGVPRGAPPACGRQWGGHVWLPGQSLWEQQAAGFRTFLFLPTRCFGSVPFSVTFPSYLPGNPELLGAPCRRLT